MKGLWRIKPCPVGGKYFYSVVRAIDPTKEDIKSNLEELTERGYSTLKDLCDIDSENRKNGIDPRCSVSEMQTVADLLNHIKMLG